MNQFEKAVQQIDESFSVIQKQSIVNCEENWNFLEKLMKEVNRNNSIQILNAIEVIIKEEQAFQYEKRKYHLERNTIQKGYDLAMEGKN